MFLLSAGYHTYNRVHCIVMANWKAFVPPQLRNSSIKLCDKIAWIDKALWHPDETTLFIPNKFQVIADWVVDQLITITKRYLKSINCWMLI